MSRFNIDPSYVPDARSNNELRRLANSPTKFGVSGGFRAGKRRKGNSLLKRSPVIVKQAGDIRKDSIIAAIERDSGAIVHINGNGAVKRLDYK